MSSCVSFQKRKPSKFEVRGYFFRYLHFPESRNENCRKEILEPSDVDSNNFYVHLLVELKRSTHGHAISQ